MLPGSFGSLLFMKRKVLIVLCFFSIAVLSGLAQQGVGEVKSFNWDIALMLTPYGIAKNLGGEPTYLTPYFHKTMKYFAVQSPLFYPYLIFHCLLASFAFFYFCRGKKS